MVTGEKDRRLHQSVALLAALVLLASTQALNATNNQSPGPPAVDKGPLTLHDAVSAELETGEVHTYRLKAAPGDFVKVTVAQGGMDFAASVIAADGRVALSINACHEDFCTERVIAVIAADSSLRIRATEATKRRGRYTIRFEEQHTATDRDRDRVAAETAFERGVDLVLRNVPTLHDEALRNFASALETYKAIGDRQGELNVLLHISEIHSDSGRATEGMAAARAAEQLARELNDQQSLVVAVLAQGLAFLRLADMPGALKAFGDSAEIARGIGDGKGEAMAVFNQASIFGRMGDSEEVIERSEYALRTFRSVGYRAIDSRLWNNIGIAYKNIGQYEKSLDAYARALEALRPDRDTDSRVVILNNMGNLKRLQGLAGEALPLHEQALALARQIGSREQEARSLNTIGYTYYAIGDYARALDYHEQALTIRRDIKDLPGQGASLNGEGRALHKLGQSDRAFEILNQAIGLSRRIYDPFGELDSLHSLAMVERDRGHLMPAIAAVRAAVDLEEKLRARITSPEVRSTFRAAEEDKYELFLDLLQLANAREPSRQYSLEALTVSERARSRVLLESLLDARVDLHEGIEPALLQRERTLQKQLSDASAQLSRALARCGADGTPTLSKRVDALSEQYADVEADIRRQSPRYAAIMQPQPATATDIQTSALDDETVLLEFALGEERSWLFALARDGITSVELPPRRTIDAAARDFYDRLTARQRRSRETAVAYRHRVAAADAALPRAGHALSDMLLGGIADRLDDGWRTKRLAIVPSGSLDYLPFAALPAPNRAAAARRTQVRLGEGHEIVTLPSASVLLAIRAETAGRAPARAALATFADPVFDASDPRVSGKSRAPIQNPLARLPFSRQEADSIAAIARTVDPDGVLEATDFAASRSALLDPSIGDYRILHIATHGIVDTERPAQTSLIFSLLDQHGATHDGYVRMRDIYNLRLRADLVVLSACQTALGTAVKGEGLVGLARAFMYAGAPRVVASLWEVSDAATAELMTRFYRLMLKANRRPAAALHEAQREMSRDPRWSAPYYWAGFVLEGDWR